MVSEFSSSLEEMLQLMLFHFLIEWLLFNRQHMNIVDCLDFRLVVVPPNFSGKALIKVHLGVGKSR